jgi:hypothetical protein
MNSSNPKTWKYRFRNNLRHLIKVWFKYQKFTKDKRIKKFQLTNKENLYLWMHKANRKNRFVLNCNFLLIHRRRMVIHRGLSENCNNRILRNKYATLVSNINEIVRIIVLLRALPHARKIKFRELKIIRSMSQKRKVNLWVKKILNKNYKSLLRVMKFRKSIIIVLS